MRLAEAISALAACETEQDVVAAVRSSARRLCGAAGIAIVWREGDECHYVAEDSEVPLWSGQRFPIGACISGWAMENGCQVAIPDIFDDPRVPHEAYRPTGILSLVMTPVGEPPAAALGAYWLDVREHSGEVRAVLKALAEGMASALRTLTLRSSLANQLGELERRRGQAEAARKEIAFQANLLDIVEQAVIATDLEGGVIYWNAFAETLYGWTRAEALGRNIVDLNVAPGHTEQAAQVMDELQAGRSWAGEIVLKRRDGSTFPAYVSDWPVTGDDGQLTAVVGVSVDNTERHRAEAHQRLLINELNHRVKNSLAIVQSIAAQSLRADSTLSEARELFQARLHALARAHGLMMDVGWRPVPLRALLATALEPFGFGSSDRLKLEGPDLQVAPRTGVSLTLAAHELGTNAVKHGALSTDRGEVELSWRLVVQGSTERFQMTWQEQDGPTVAPPAERGFGSRLIEKGLAAELRGRVTMHFEPGGLVCQIDAPASEALALADEPTSLFPLPA